MSGTWFNEALEGAIRRRTGQQESLSPDVERGGGMYTPPGVPESFGPHHPPQGGSEEELIPAMESLGRPGGLGDPFVVGAVTGGLGDPAFVTQAVLSGDQSSVPSQHTGPPLSGSQVFHSVPGSQVTGTSGSTVSVGGIPGPSQSVPSMPSFQGVPVQQFFQSMPAGMPAPMLPVWPCPPSSGPKQVAESSGTSEQLTVRAIQAMQAQTEVLTNTVGQVLQAQSAQFQQLMGLLSMQQAVGAAPVVEGTAGPSSSVPYTRLAGRTPPPPPPVGAESSSVFKNVDSKLLPPMPTVDVNKWSTRPQEIVGFQTYLEALIAWLCVCVCCNPCTEQS